MTAPAASSLQVIFLTEPDVTGRGRLIVNGRYFSLPMEAVLEYQALREGQPDTKKLTELRQGNALLEAEVARLTTRICALAPCS